MNLQYMWRRSEKFTIKTDRSIWELMKREKTFREKISELRDVVEQNINIRTWPLKLCTHGRKRAVSNFKKMELYKKSQPILS